MKWHPRSVRFRIALALAAVLAVLLSGFSASVYALARKHVLAEVGMRARQDVALLEQEISEDPQEASEMDDSGLVALYTITRGDRPLHISTGWRKRQLPPAEELLGNAKGTHRTSWEGRDFAVVTKSVPIRGEIFTITVAEDEGPAQKSLASLATILLIGLPVTIAAAFAGGSFLARRLLSPLSGLARAAGRISEERLSGRLPVENPADEFGELALAFNQTFARIEDAFEKTRRFTSDASHELRTPLTALRSVGEAALRGRLDSEGYREAIGSMLEESSRLTRLVDGLLLLAREDSDAYRARFARVDLGDITREVVDILRVLAEERGQRIETVIASGVAVHGDRTSLRQTVFNLVDNAIKYAPPGGTIRVLLRPSGAGDARLEVSDDGPGIAPEHRERIFERFYRIESDRSRSTGGSGLGLSIARWAAELHGGRIELATEEGNGTTFVVSLPLDRHGAAPAELSVLTGASPRHAGNPRR